MKMLGVKEVQELLKVKRTKAYALIKQMNEELKAQGYIVIPGRIPEQYLLDRFYK